VADLHRGDRRGEGPTAGRVVLDTDVFSYLYEYRPEGERFRPLVGVEPAIAFATAAELLFGAAKAAWGPDRVLRLESALAGVTILLPDEGLVRVCALLRADAFRRRHPLGHRANANDLWIAACAMHHRVPLVTGNVRHFERLPGLTLLAPEGVR
jgi:predicted nucleic acid-binding protein